MDSDFTDGSTHYKKGKILGSNVFETDQRLISKKDLEQVYEKTDYQDYVIFQTLKVPLILQRGDPKFIDLLCALVKMPDSNKEQKPIDILVSYLDKRD